MKILDAPCPFWKDKSLKVKDTHLLTLIPKTLDGKEFSLDLLGEIIMRPKSGHFALYGYYKEELKKAVGSTPVNESYWILITINAIPGSRSENFEEQKKLLKKFAEESQFSYGLPKTIEAATAILTHHVKTGQKFYLKYSPICYTRCEEVVSGQTIPTMIGNFSDNGLFLETYASFGKNIGASGSLKLPPGK